MHWIGDKFNKLLTLAVVPEELQILQDTDLGGANTSVAKLESVFRILFPALEAIPIDIMLRLRSSGYRHDFRSWLEGLPTNGSDETLTIALMKPLLELCKTVRPRVREMVLAGIGGNIPGVPLNPISVWTAGRDVYEHRKRKNTFGAQFFLAELDDEFGLSA